MEAENKYLNEITVKYSKKLFTNNTIKTSEDVEAIAREIFNKCKCQLELKEYFFIILLNRANQVVGYHKLSEGGICGTVVDIRIAFATALKSLASTMMLVHNHPSGNLKPSEADIRITKQFAEAGKFLEIIVHDHLIITQESYYSFADEGRL
jgi:DNA repair protein RadC